MLCVEMESARTVVCQDLKWKTHSLVHKTAPALLATTSVMTESLFRTNMDAVKERVRTGASQHLTARAVVHTAPVTARTALGVETGSATTLRKHESPVRKTVT